MIEEEIQPDTTIIDKPKENTSQGDDSPCSIMLLNDSVTEMGFVVFSLCEVFDYGLSRAKATMMIAHKTGSALVGTYNKNNACKLIEAAMALNNRCGQSLGYKIIS